MQTAREKFKEFLVYTVVMWACLLYSLLVLGMAWTKSHRIEHQLQNPLIFYSPLPALISKVEGHWHRFFFVFFITFIWENALKHFTYEFLIFRVLFQMFDGMWISPFLSLSLPFLSLSQRTTIKAANKNRTRQNFWFMTCMTQQL